jgi:hypothetical protein
MFPANNVWNVGRLIGFISTTAIVLMLV